MTIRRGVTAPPQRALNALMPSARGRSLRGSQTLKDLARFGKQPDSPMPNKNRITTSDERFHAHPVAPVKNAPHRTMRNSRRREPIQSPSQPLGISNSAYANANAE